MSAPTTPADRSSYVDEVTALLWPGAAVTVGATAATGTPYLLLPNARRPRLLVPAGSRRAAASAVRGYGAAGGSLAARALAAGLRAGLAQRAFRDRVHVGGGTPSLLAHLSEALGTELLASLYLSAPRANRKPVLQLLDVAGRRVGYAKVGVDPLTTRLVRAETAALRRLAAADLPGLVVPRVTYAGSWHGHEVLVQSALPVPSGRGRAVRPEPLTVATRLVADLDRDGAGPLTTTAFWRRLCARVAGLPDGPAAAGLTAVLAALGDHVGRAHVETGSWHGDWTPWNMRAVPGGLAVWDWERFAAGVPRGFDALHHGLQRDLMAGALPPTAAVRRCLDGAAERLSPLGVEAAEATTLCYLTELATRYAEDGQAESGARWGRVQDWLIPGLQARMEGYRG